MATVKRVLAIIVILALLIGGSAPFLASMSPAAAQDDEYESFSAELAEQLAEIYKQKQALTPVQRKIDSSILQVVREVQERVSSAHSGETPKLRDLSTHLLKIDDTGNIEVKLTVTSLSDEQLEQLEDLGMNIRLTLLKYGVIEGSLPHDQVEAVAGLDFVVSVATPGYPLLNTGSVTSEGDAVLRADEARVAFGVDGSGIMIGVMSDGVNNLAASVATGDLPSSPAVDVLKDDSGDEGTAMLEIIHDLAPGSPLAFYTGIVSSSDMIIGIGALEAAGAKVIVDDIGWSDEPKFEDGPLAQRARQFVTDGGVYVTSAGNSAQRHYMATYTPVGSSPGGGYADIHDYGGGDQGNTFTVPDDRTIITILQWNNQWGLSGDDFDLVLVRASNGATLALSTNWQEGDGDPWEGLGWTNNTGSPVTVYIVVLEWSLVSTPSSLLLDYHVWHAPPLQYFTTANSVIGHSAVEEVLSTAAAYWDTPDTIEPFSSRGPGTIYFPTYEDRQVPNITGVDGVQNTGPGSFPSVFTGTSASAPHVAAIAALVWEADPTLTSSEVFNTITSTAVDLGPVGWDDTWGFGRVDAYEAVASVTLLTMEPIVEPEGQYYNTAPVLSNFGFDDNLALDDGWYQMDSFADAWTVLFSDVAGTSWDSDNWTIPDFGALSEGSHTIYFKASNDAANVEGESGEWSWQFFKDTVPPSDPTVVSSISHTISTWSADNTVVVTWTDATDSTSGLDGYSILWDTSADTIPDPTKNIEGGVEATTSSALADGNSHYFHIRSVDNAGNWQSTVHLGPFFIDATPPTISDLSPVDGSTITDTTPLFSATITDNIEVDATTVVMTVDGAAVAATFDAVTGVISYQQPADLDLGEHTFTVDASDTAGNAATQASSTFTIVALAEEFTLANLSVTPTSGGAPLTITASVDVTNISGVSGDYTAELKVDGTMVDSTIVTVAAGATESVSFTYALTTEGTYQVTIDELTAIEVTVSAFDAMDYDVNGDGIIDKSEAIDAIWDYFDGIITKDQAIEVLWLYFA